MELEDVQKPDHEILILNHSQNETVCYPLVLLEGVIRQNAKKTGLRRLLQMSSSETLKNSELESGNKLQVLDSASMENACQRHQDELTLQIKSGIHQMTWPVVKGGFKVVVPLTNGENLITLKMLDRVDTCEVKLKLTFAPLTISR